MRSIRLLLAFIGLLTVAAAGPATVTADPTEAEAALAILDTLAAGREPAPDAWARLYATPAYRRLKQREAGMNRAFDDAEFAAFLRSPAALARRDGWRTALARWSPATAREGARRAARYLPATARLSATIYLTIKPKPNEFVFGLGDDPAIFLYLDPALPPGKALNTVTHELHHIGLGSVCLAAPPSADPGVAKLRRWLGGFGEGFAMLAAAGSPQVHPHRTSAPAERAVWDANLAQVDAWQAEQDAFFVSVLNGRAGNDAAVDAHMRDYYGVQGPWYVVGWRMARAIEEVFGRARLIDAFCRPHTLLATYNAAVQKDGQRLPQWNARLANRLAATDPARP